METRMWLKSGMCLARSQSFSHDFPMSYDKNVLRNMFSFPEFISVLIELLGFSRPIVKANLNLRFGFGDIDLNQNLHRRKDLVLNALRLKPLGIFSARSNSQNLLFFSNCDHFFSLNYVQTKSLAKSKWLGLRCCNRALTNVASHWWY